MEGVLESFKANRGLLEDLKSKCQVLIKELLTEAGIKYHSIEARVKDEESLKKKLEQKQTNGINNKLDDIEITDLVGLRIITYYEDEVDKIEEILRSEFKVDEENSVDKRHKREDEFGYLSLHLILCINDERAALTEYKNYTDIKFEVQIRSILQHACAVVSHELKYKNADSFPEKIHRKLNRMASILEEVDDGFKSIRDMTIDYMGTVVKNIEDKEYDNKEPINQISLEGYLQNSETVKVVLEEMLDVMQSSSIEIYPSNFLHVCVEKLKNLKILTLSQLDNATKENATEIPKVFKSWLEIVNKIDSYKGIAGIPLESFIFYLTMLEIIKRYDTINEDIVETYFEGVVSFKNEEKKNFIDNLIQLQKEYIASV